MTPRKRPLLDVLREKERRQQGRREEASAAPVRPPAPTPGLPSWLLPAVGGLLLLLLAIWGFQACGAQNDPSEQNTGGAPLVEEESAAKVQGEVAVLAITYDLAREADAITVARTLIKDFGYDVKLARASAPDGRQLRELFVVQARDRDLSTAQLLAEVQALRLPGQPNERPFSGAILRRLPAE